MADAIFGLILFYSLILGARRGFYKEVIHALALVISIFLARELRVPAGAWLHAKTHLPVILSEVVAVIVVWAGSFFVVAVVGRLILKELRGDGVDEELEDEAEELADALAGDTKKGPVTLLTDPIANKTGMFYWSDKVLGACLGLLKGAVTGYVLFGLLVYADHARGWNSTIARSFAASYAKKAFVKEIDPYLVSFPEYKIAKSLGEMDAIAKAVKKDPRRFMTFVQDPQLKGLRNDPKVVALGKDPEVMKAFRAHDFKKLLFDPKVRELLTDPATRKRFAEVDWAKVRQHVEQTKPMTPAEAAKAMAEQGKRALSQPGAGQGGGQQPTGQAGGSTQPSGSGTAPSTGAEATPAGGAGTAPAGGAQAPPSGASTPQPAGGGK